MRLLLLSVAALLVYAGSAQASQVPSSAPVFSNGTCSRGITCPGEADYSSDPSYMSRLVSQANTCVRKNFSIQTDGEPIEDSYGLDSDGCFTTKTMPKAKTGLTMTPVCCVVPDGTGRTCQISCTLYGVR